MNFEEDLKNRYSFECAYLQYCNKFNYVFILLFDSSLTKVLLLVNFNLLVFPMINLNQDV